LSEFAPADTKTLVEIVAAALAREEPLELVAGGSKRGLGRPPQAAHTLSLAGFSGIRDYEPAELVLTAGAATPLDEIERALAERRQMLAFEPGDWRALLGASGQRQTLSGTISCNLAGPRRIRQGAARDHFLGFSGVSGRGESFKAGGKVVKNVTGYDLCKLIAGSYGTLAALTEIAIKVLPLPESVATVALLDLSVDRAVKAMTQGLNASHELSGAAHLPAGLGADRAMTILRVEGPVPSVVARAAGLREELKSFGAIEILGDRESAELWNAVRDATPFTAENQRAIWRVSVAPQAAPALLAVLDRALDAQYFLDWGGGLVWLAVRGAPDGGASAIRAALPPDGGHATLILGSAALRAAVPVFQPLAPAVAALSARVKDGFDPKRIFNRGRLYAEI
jgi:glycolate oxidase FAD binding subunit